VAHRSTRVPRARAHGLSEEFLPWSYPKFRDVDFRISRDFTIYRERYKLQIIAEAFNLFNHTMVTL